MTWKQRRTNTILACIAAGMFALILILAGARYRDSRDAAQNPQITPGQAVFSGKNGEPPACTALQYQNSVASLSFSLNENGKWVWDDDPEFPLNDAVLLEMIETLGGLHFQQTLDATESMESYGFTDSSAGLSVTDGQGVKRTLVFGKTTTDGKSRYLQMNGDESTVYIVDGGIYQLLQTPVYDMCKLPELPDLTPDKLLGLTIQGPVPEAGTSESGEPEEVPEPPEVTLEARHSDGGTLWFQGGSNVTDNAQLKAMLEDLSGMSFARCLDYRPSSEAAEICGFAHPEAVLKVTYGTEASGQTLTLTIGAAMDSDRCVRLNDSETVYLMSGEFLDPLLTVAKNGLDA